MREEGSTGSEANIAKEGSKIILVIDDDKIMRDLFKNYLSKLGYSVAVTGEGEEGLKLANKLRPLFWMFKCQVWMVGGYYRG